VQTNIALTTIYLDILLCIFRGIIFKLSDLMAGLITYTRTS